ncbi:MAG: TolC family protein [Planctomycetia bacterium]|nr:TolC family protein [Planctomycetia bacterium]
MIQTAYRQEAGDPVVEPEPLPPAVLPVEDSVIEGNAGTDALTLEALEQIALANNPSIGEAWAGVEAARGKWVQAGLPPNPRLGYSGQQIGSDGLAEQHGVYIEQEVIRGGKLRLNRDVVEEEINRAEQLLAAQTLRVQTDVRMSYYKVLCAERRLELAEELVSIGNQASQVAERLLEKKEGSRRDLLQARIESNSAMNFHQHAHNQHIGAWRALAAVLGSPAMLPQPLAGEIDDVAPEYDWEDSLQRLVTESPEMGAAFANIERARWTVDRAYIEAVPDVNVQGIVQQDNSTGSSNGALLVSLPIPFLNRNQGGIRQAENEIIAAQQAAQRVELGLQRRLARVFERYLTARNRVSNFRDGILRDAEESLTLTKQGYESGELGFLDLLTAQRTYSQTNLGYVEALYEMWTDSAEMDGLLLTNSLGVGTESTGG